MSHVVTIHTKVRDPAALSAACARLGLTAPEQGGASLYAGEATGSIVRLPGWTYPVVFDLTAGEARYDNFEGRWGDSTELDRLLQAYAIEKVRLEARGRFTVREQVQADGSVLLLLRTIS
jgi:hypothetical protein